MSYERHHDQVARQVRAAGSSFYWAMRLQDQNRRRALFAIYAYCRALDDIADGPLPASAKREALEQWRKRIAAVYSRSGDERTELSDPLVHALKDAVSHFALPKDPLLALIRGMETDVSAPLNAPSWPELLAYCDDVAGAVGDLCLAVWGWRGTEAAAFAQTTGRALQLTNILRDVWADAALGRLYLPEDVLETAGITASTPDAVVEHANLPQACRLVADIAAQGYEDIKASWPRPFPRTLRSAHVMVSVYQKLFDKIVAHDWKTRARISLGPAEKLTSAMVALLSHP